MFTGVLEAEGRCRKRGTEREEVTERSDRGG